MASQRQLEANRLNSRRSTGPRSVSGKARSGRNAVKHGLTAKMLISGEKPQEFERFRASIIADRRPIGAIQHELVDRLAGLLWRLRRCPSVEAQLLNQLLGRTISDHVDLLTDEELTQLEEIYGRVLPLIEGAEPKFLTSGNPPEDRASAPKVELLPILARHETSLMNDVIKTMSLLNAIQAARGAQEPIKLIEADRGRNGSTRTGRAAGHNR